MRALRYFALTACGLLAIASAYALTPRQRAVVLGGGPAADVIIVAGQSNSVVLFTTAASLPANLQTVDPKTFVWTGSKFVGLQNGVNGDQTTETAPSQYWGPEAEFALKWRQTHSTPLYFVKYGVGSTPLYNVGGSHADWSPSNAIGLFPQVTSWSAGAIAALKASGKKPKVRAVLWMQGESDAQNSTYASNYQTNLAAWVTSVRSLWGDANTKILSGRINTYAPWVYDGTVQDAQAYVHAQLSKSGIVNTDAYGRQGDGIHLSAAGIVSFGDDLYSLYNNTFALGSIGTPAGGTVGSAYSFQPFTNGGISPYTFSLTAGTLPGGLSLDTAHGTISGTPTTVETQSGITIHVVDSVGAAANLSGLSIAVTSSSVALTWDPLNIGSQGLLANSNRDFSSPSGGFASVRAVTGKTTGSWYVEYTLTVVPSGTVQVGVGIGENDFNLDSYLGNSAHSAMIWFTSNSDFANGLTKVNAITPGSATVNDVYGMAFDATNGKVWLSKNCTWYNTGLPALGLNPWLTFTAGGNWFPAATANATAPLGTVRLASTATCTVPTGFTLMNQ